MARMGHSSSIPACDLLAEHDVLRMEARAADAERLARIENVVERHLVPFGAKDERAVIWTPA